MIKNPDFIIIPHQLILDKNLQPLDRVLYGVIYWLVKLKNEKCVASNKTLKELCGCKTNRAISNSLENLEKHGYILRRYFDNKKRRRNELIPLIVFSKVGTNDDTVGTNDDTGVGTNDEQNNKSTIIIKDNKRITPSDEMRLFIESEEYFNNILKMIVNRGAPEQIAKNELLKFRSYWTELNKTGTRQRWEMEKTFEIKRRLATWLSKTNQFNQRSNQKEKQIYNTLQ